MRGFLYRPTVWASLPSFFVAVLPTINVSMIDKSTEQVTEKDFLTAVFITAIYDTLYVRAYKRIWTYWRPFDWF